MKMMKVIYVTVMMLVFTGSMFAQSVGINDNGSSPNSKAMLDVSSTTKGFLPPRMTTGEIIAITSPPEGLMVYNTTIHSQVFYNGTNWKKTDGTYMITYSIGQSYGGGIIFYIDATEQHGLIAATSDQSTGALWGCYGTLISGADGTAIGTGNQNTHDIMAGCATAGIAARICGDLVLNGYSDWFLPSKDELNQMYLQRAVIGGFASSYYWSSSEYSGSYAWLQSFSNGSQYYPNKLDIFYVRAVRAF